jgi:hypothetical protein
MAEINLTQLEADALHKMEKISTDDAEYDLPDLGGKISVALASFDKKEHFLLDLYRGQISLKRTYQNRSRDVIVLARIDFGVSHRNPPELGGHEIGSPHLHIYKEGFGDKYAVEIPRDIFFNLEDKWQVLQDFMKYCNITKVPNFRRGLFS